MQNRLKTIHETLENILEGLKRMERIKDKSGADAENKRRKFAMRQAVRSARKYGSEEVVGETPTGMNPTLPSYYAIGQQFGADLVKNKKGEYQHTPYSPTEDKALTGRPKQDEGRKELFKKTFMDTLKKRRALSK
jgi:hypothetical protein